MSPTPAARPAPPFTLLHVITDLDVGGAQLALARMITQMDRARFRHRVVSLLPSGPVEEMLAAAGIPVTSLELPRGRVTPAGLWRLRRLIREWQPHVVGSWLYHADLLATLALLPGRSVPLIWNLRSARMDMQQYSWVSRATRRACAVLSHQPDVIVANSATGQAFHAQLGYRPRAWEIVFNGVETDHYRPDPGARREIRQELGLPADSPAPLIGVLARYDPMKGHPVFLEAARQIAERHPDVQFLLAGTGVEAATPYFQEFRDAHPALAPRVHLLGRRSDTARLMAALDVYCLPSIGEGFPNVVAEAMACGVPCAVTDAGDARTIVGDTGVVVPVGQASALADGCLALLGEDTPTRVDRSRRARARVVDLFNLPRAVRAYEAIFERVVEARHSRPRHAQSPS
jgi:glycosyltransferase involved in cell wall biosynthesis